MLNNDRNLIALDFDGVLCDSAAETGVTAWRAGRTIWSDWNTLEPPPECLQRFREWRPLLEFGYQSIALMRLAWMDVPSHQVNHNFGPLVSQVFADVNHGTDELIEIFGATRDKWIESDQADWLSRHTFYDGTLQKLKHAMAANEVFILTTKQERFIQALLENRKIAFPDDHIFGLDAGRPKEDILTDLVQQDRFRSLPCHFVEDRVKTLQRILECPPLQRIRLYLATWGYNTPQDRKLAAASKKINILILQNFLQ